MEDIGVSAFPGPEDLWEQHFVEGTYPESSDLSSITGCLRPLFKEHDRVLQVKKEVQESLATR